MDREGAETHLRLLAEAELRRVMKMPVGSIPGRWYSDRLVLVAQALTAVDAIAARILAAAAKAAAPAPAEVRTRRTGPKRSVR
jgi:hypothetical protein